MVEGRHGLLKRLFRFVEPKKPHRPFAETVGLRLLQRKARRASGHMRECVCFCGQRVAKLSKWCKTPVEGPRLIASVCHEIVFSGSSISGQCPDMTTQAQRRQHKSFCWNQIYR